MEKQNNILWNLTSIFFIFFSIFIAFKFVFIFFFRAAFEPGFIFELTPLYILLGMNNLQLLFLSLVVVVFDAYLHLKPTRKNILYSFIPTLIMVSGLGVGITTKEISLDYVPHYLLFGFLLLVVLIDQRRTLMHPETLATAEPKETELISQPSKSRFSLPKVKLSFRGRPKPEGVPIARPKPKLSVPVASSLFSLFKRGKKTSETESEETPEEPKPVSTETVQKEEADFKVEEITSEISTPAAKPDAEEEPPEEFKTAPSSKDKEKPEGDVHFGGATAGGGGTAIPLFETKKDIDSLKADSYKHSPLSSYKPDETGIGMEFKPKEEPKFLSETPGDSKISDDQQKVEEFHERSLDEIEKIFPKEKREFKDKIDFKKEKIGLIAETQKTVIPKKDWDELRDKLANRKKEITTETHVIQDVQSDFKKIEGGLDSLKNKLENLGEEIESAVRETIASNRKQEMRGHRDESFKETKPSIYSEDSRRLIEREIVEPHTAPQEWIAEERRSDIIKAQIILEELEKKVEKLERIYVYQID